MGRWLQSVACNIKENHLTISVRILSLWFQCNNMELHIWVCKSRWDISYTVCQESLCHVLYQGVLESFNLFTSLTSFLKNPIPGCLMYFICLLYWYAGEISLMPWQHIPELFKSYPFMCFCETRFLLDTLFIYQTCAKNF